MFGKKAVRGTLSPGQCTAALTRGALVLSTAVALLCAAATESRAGERVHFSLTNNVGGIVRVQCTGPWGRTSKLRNVKFGDSKTFYTAEQTIFSMFGAG